MIKYRYILLVLWCLMASVVSFAQNWTDAASVKRELIKTANNRKTYYSQQNYYDPRKSEIFNSIYKQVLNHEPQIYGVDFYYASGTWFSQQDVKKTRENLIKIVKHCWRERRAIACFSWHLENPYVPTGFPKYMGCRYIYHKEIPHYPAEHRYIIKEILENGGDVCGKGNISGKDNHRSYKNPREWFEDRCKEVASVINEFVDADGKPIPFIFRLWHEWEDSWMWWGTKYVSADNYKRFFILTEQTIQKYAPKAQILWAYCSDRFRNSETEFMERYPGDKYVDIIGFDDYELGLSEENWTAAVNRARMVSRIAEKRHLATGLFETNNNKQKVPHYYTNYLNRMLKTNGVRMGIVQIWSLKTFNDSVDIKTFLNQKNIVTIK